MKLNFLNSVLIIILLSINIYSSEINEIDYQINEKDLIEELLQIHSELKEELPSYKTIELLSQLDEQLLSDSNHFNNFYYNQINLCNKVKSDKKTFLSDIQEYLSSQEIKLNEFTIDINSNNEIFISGQDQIIKENSELDIIFNKQKDEDKNFENIQKEKEDKILIIDECIEIITENLMKNNNENSSQEISFVQLKTNLNQKFNSLVKMLSDSSDSSMILILMKTENFLDEKTVGKILNILKELKNKIKNTSKESKSFYENQKILFSNMNYSKKEYLNKLKEKIAKSKQIVESLSERVSLIKNNLIQFKLIHKKYEDEKNDFECEKILVMINQMKEDLEESKQFTSREIENQSNK